MARWKLGKIIIMWKYYLILLLQIFGTYTLFSSLFGQYSCYPCYRLSAPEDIVYTLFGLPVLIINAITVLVWIFKTKTYNKVFLGFVLVESVVLGALHFNKVQFDGLKNIRFAIPESFLQLYFIVAALLVYLPFFSSWLFIKFQKIWVVFICTLLQLAIFGTSYWLINVGTQNKIDYIKSVKTNYIQECKANKNIIQNQFIDKKYSTQNGQYTFEIEVLEANGCSIAYNLVGKDKAGNKALLVKNQFLFIANNMPEFGIDYFENLKILNDINGNEAFGYNSINYPDYNKFLDKIKFLAEHLEIIEDKDYEYIRFIYNVANEKFDIGCPLPQNSPIRQQYKGFDNISQYQRKKTETGFKCVN